MRHILFNAYLCSFSGARLETVRKLEAALNGMEKPNSSFRCSYLLARHYMIQKHPSNSLPTNTTTLLSNYTEAQKRDQLWHIM